MHVQLTPAPRHRFNHAPTTSKKGKWTNWTLEDAMEAVESETSSLRGATRSWCILLTNISNHLNKKTRSRKVKPQGVLMKEKDAMVVVWTLAM